MDYAYFIKTFLLSIGLAIDTCLISISNGINMKCVIKKSKLCLVALCFAFFQAIMPLVGYLIGFSIIKYIKHIIPYISLVILCFFGIKMIITGILNKGKIQSIDLKFWQILSISFATSLDSLSIGLTFAEYTFLMLCVSSIMIAVMNFVLSFIGVLIGKHLIKENKNRAEIIGGSILIVMAIVIFVLSIL